MASPVAGLRPIRAARLRTCRMPRPTMRMRSPFLRCLVIIVTMSVKMLSACFFESSCASAIAAARCFSVTVVGVAAFFAIFGPPRFQWLGKPRRSRPYLIRALADYVVLPAKRAFMPSFLRGLGSDDASAGVAQLVRAPPCHGGGRGFESRLSRHFWQRIQPPTFQSLQSSFVVSAASMLIAFLVGAASIVPASAQAPYPNRPIRIVVPFGAGGFADITVRRLAQRLAERTGAQVVVENRPGAGGIVAATAVTSSEADGYTLFVFSSGIALSKALLKSMPFDPVSAFAPISTMALFDLLLLVKADSPMQTLKDVLAAAGADPKSFQRRHDQSRQHPERHRRTAPRRRRHSDDGGDTTYLGGGSDLAAPGR